MRKIKERNPSGKKKEINFTFLKLFFLNKFLFFPSEGKRRYRTDKPIISMGHESGCPEMPSET